MTAPYLFLCRTPGAACRLRCWRAFSTRFSPPSRLARAPGWGCRSATRSSRTTAGRFARRPGVGGVRVLCPAGRARRRCHYNGVPDMNEPIRILFVDDEERILRSLALQFRRDYQVLTESDPRRALERLKSEPVHIIVSDQRMPQM